MDKKRLIKALEQIPGNPEIGMNVLTNVGSEFWGFNLKNMKIMDNGITCSLHQIRLHDPIPRRKLITLKIQPCWSADCTADSVKERISARYQIDQEPTEEMTYTEACEVILDVIVSDIEELLRLRDDFLILVADDELKKKYNLEELPNV